jgi:acyl dehydratase
MYFEDFQVGQTWRTQEPVVLSAEQIIAFAQVYDPARIHLDQEFAEASRFGGLIAPGVQTVMATWAQFIREYDIMGDQLVGGLRRDCHFPLPVYVGDALTAEYQVREAYERNPYNGYVGLDFQVFNQDGQVVAFGQTDLVQARKR